MRIFWRNSVITFNGFYLNVFDFNAALKKIFTGESLII